MARQLMCIEHPSIPHPCRRCAAEKRHGTPDDFANLRAVLDEATRAAREEAATRAAS